MHKKESLFPNKQSFLKNKEVIEMVASLYIILLRSGLKINANEVDILYTLLENLFKFESISWESYIREINQDNLSLNKILSYLNKHLITLDKLRVLLSLIVLANSDSAFSASEVTKILELAKKMNVETEGFMAIIDAIEHNRTNPASIKGFKYFNHTHRSIFRDYIIIGRSLDSDVRFKNPLVSDHELLVLLIDEFVFVGTNKNCVTQINGVGLLNNRLYIMPKNSQLKIKETSFSTEHLQSLCHTQDSYDVIDFKKTNYDFQLINNRNRYKLTVTSGEIYQNKKLVPHNKEMSVYYDDLLQIKDYTPFNLVDVIQRRAEIGVSKEDLKPNILFINYDNDYFNMTRGETSKTIANIKNENDNYILYPPKRGWIFFINNKKIETPTQIYINTDTITINKRNFRINNFLDLVEIPFEVEQIQFMDIRHIFKDNNVGIDGVSFEVGKGELCAILGQSGCGKSTLLKCIGAQIIPTYGGMIIDGKNVYNNISYFTQYIGFVPQEDLLFSNLTVYENLLYRGQLQMPKISREHLNQKINNILTQTNLIMRKSSLVGDEKRNFLSGGERKRLNIALELLFEPTIIICDEPTSGLSSSDSEQIIDMLKELTSRGKIVVITIHQPNSGIFEKFDKVLLMDNGGKQIFFGKTEKAFSYFDQELNHITIKKKEILKKYNLKMPEYMYDIIEYPEYKENGDVSYIQVNQNINIKRKFPADYWRDKFKRKMLFDLMQINPRKEKNTGVSNLNARKKLDIQAHFVQLKSYFMRNLFTKMRNKSNMFITFGEAPLLAFLISFILRLAPNSGSYSYYKNVNISIYLFMSVIVFIFLGLSSGIEEILSERKNILREKMLNFKMRYYLITKTFTLSLFAFIQVLLYHFVCSFILQIKGVFLPSLIYFFTASFVGFSSGLLASCFIHNSKAVINILPIILIPQIIFGGAIVQFEKMNKELTISQTNPIPEIVQVIPSRWLFEGIFVAYAKKNNYEKGLAICERKRLTLGENYRKGKINSQNYKSNLYLIYDKKKEISIKYPKKKYTNELISLSVDMMDGKFLNKDKNIFLSSHKIFFGKILSTFSYNLIIVFSYLIFINFATYIKLKFYYKE